MEKLRELFITSKTGSNYQIKENSRLPHSQESTVTSFLKPIATKLKSFGA